MGTRVERFAVLWALALASMVLAGCSDDEAATPTSDATTTTATATTSAPVLSCDDPATCTTRELADAAGVMLGAAVRAEYLGEPEYRSTVAETFNSVTPELELKWDFIHPERDEWNFEEADQIVDFAREEGIAVKGHALIWDQDLVDSTPDWVLAIDDPDELRTVLTEHITTMIERYADGVDRWDVVNEPLETLGTEPYDNHFRQVLGDDYIAQAFAIARGAGPDEELWLNEATAELSAPKAAALVDLVQGLVDDGVSIDGVGIQGHLIGGTVDPATLQQLIADLEDLGVDVAITELDVPLTSQPEPRQVQAEVYGDVLGACFATACREVTLWGFTDRYTWLDDFLGEGLAPLPFDTDYRPKPALDAIRDELAVAAD